jgi:phosphoribosylanthranilate isomerase
VDLETVRKANLTIVQLHGSENPSYLEALKGIRIIKAFRVGRDFDASILSDYRADYYLLDTFFEGSHGGTGMTFDWSLVQPSLKQGKIILAGGLHAGNVGDALEIAHPWGVDVSTGVEAFPGIKDTEKMHEFFRAVDKYERNNAAIEYNSNRCEE